MLDVQSIPSCYKDDSFGRLYPVELDAIFKPRRVFWVSGVKKGETRGNHAHLKCRQVYVCIAGNISVTAKNSDGKVEIVSISEGQYVVVEPGIWTSETYLTGADVLLVLASDPYDKNDYSDTPVKNCGIIGRGAFYHEFVDVFGETDRNIIAIQKSNVRALAYEDYKNYKYSMFIHQTALVSDSASLRDGTIIMPYSIVSNNVTAGKFFIVDKHCSVGHDSIIADFVTLAPGARVGGKCIVGRSVYIGSNATIKQSITIAANVVVGAGAVVVKDITEPGVYAGVPAKKIKEVSGAI